MCRRKWLNYANFWSIKSFLRVLKAKTRIFFLTHHSNLISPSKSPSFFPFSSYVSLSTVLSDYFRFLQLFHFHFIWYAFIFSIFSLYLQQSESILELFDLFVNHFSFLKKWPFFLFSTSSCVGRKNRTGGNECFWKGLFESLCFFSFYKFLGFFFPNARQTKRLSESWLWVQHCNN